MVVSLSPFQSLRVHFRLNLMQRSSPQFFKVVDNFVILKHITCKVVVVQRLSAFEAHLDGRILIFGKTPLVTAVTQRRQCLFPGSIIYKSYIFKVEFPNCVSMLVDKLGDLGCRHVSISDLHVSQLWKNNIWSRGRCRKGRHWTSDLCKKFVSTTLQWRIVVEH